VTRRRSSATLGNRLDQSRWFNTVWGIAFCAIPAVSLGVGAIATDGVVRLILALGAVIFAVGLLYTVLMLTVGMRYIGRLIQAIEKSRHAKAGRDDSAEEPDA